MQNDKLNLAKYGDLANTFNQCQVFVNVFNVISCFMRFCIRRYSFGLGYAPGMCLVLHVYGDLIHPMGTA
jgi:hypothetical protein